MRIRCRDCRHLFGVGFDTPDARELELIDRLKIAHDAHLRGTVLPVEPGLVATLYSGWALQRLPAPGGTLRAARILLPGDMIGLAHAAGEAPEGGELVAATDITLCRFEPEGVAQAPQGPLGQRLFRVGLREASEAKDALAVLRALPANGRTAWLVHDLYARLARRKLARDGAFLLPVLRRDLAELLGLTPMHFRRSCAALLSAGAAQFGRERVTILDAAKLRDMAGGAVEADGPCTRTLF